MCMKLFIEDETYLKLVKLLEKTNNCEILSEFEKAKERFEKSKTPKLTAAAAKASAAKVKNSKTKVQEAVNTLKEENLNITGYSIAKISGLHYNTANKYYKELKKDGKL